MPNRAPDWLAQAVRDLEHARASAAAERHEWACFAAQQSANGHPEGAPFEHYGRLQSEQAIRYAGEILDYVRSQMA